MIYIKPNQEYDLLTAFPDREDAIDKLMEKYAIADIHYAIFNSEDIVPNTVCYPFKGKYITVFLKLRSFSIRLQNKNEGVSKNNEKNIINMSYLTELLFLLMPILKRI